MCPRCARWNLSPPETRWEAIEECERLFRDEIAAVADRLAVPPEVERRLGRAAEG